MALNSHENVARAYVRWVCSCGLKGEWTTGRWYANWRVHEQKLHPGQHEWLPRDRAVMTRAEADQYRSQVRSHRAGLEVNKRGRRHPASNFLIAGLTLRITVGGTGLITLRGLPRGSVVLVDGQQRCINAHGQVRDRAWRFSVVEVELLRYGLEGEGVGAAVP